MKKNGITITLAVLLVVAIGCSVALAMNGGTLLPQPTPTSTVESTAEPTPSSAVEPTAEPTPTSTVEPSAKPTETPKEESSEARKNAEDKFTMSAGGVSIDLPSYLKNKVTFSNTALGDTIAGLFTKDKQDEVISQNSGEEYASLLYITAISKTMYNEIKDIPATEEPTIVNQSPYIKGIGNNVYIIETAQDLNVPTDNKYYKDYQKFFSEIENWEFNLRK